MVSDVGAETIQLIISYAKTWHLLLAYDEGELRLPEKGTETTSHLDYNAALEAINSLKSNLSGMNEASQLFGRERDKGLESIINNIDLTFDGEALYKSVEERAANLLYFIIKDRPFTDGNKRIACLIFLIYLKSQNKPIKINENGLVALALLIAESNPAQKEIMIRLTVNLLVD